MKNNGLRELLEQLTTQQLDEMLRAELRKKPVDGSSVRLIMQILEERETDRPVEMNAEIRAAWREYTKQERVLQKKVPAWPGTLLRVASVILVLCLLFWVVPQAEAAPSLWDRFLRLTESVFEFFAPGDTSDHHVSYEFVTDHPGLQQVYDAVVEMGITDPVVPTWLPEGYELAEIKNIYTPTTKKIHSSFSCGARNIIFRVEIYSENTTHDYFKGDPLIITQEYGGITHNVLHNNERLVAIWTREDIECFLTIECQEDVLYKILESIYIMGDD